MSFDHEIKKAKLLVTVSRELKEHSSFLCRLLFTNLGGERRFASIVAKRLESLGALTQGDRRWLSFIVSIEFFEVSKEW